MLTKAYCGNHFTTYVAKPLCCTPETKLMQRKPFTKSNTTSQLKTLNKLEIEGNLNMIKTIYENPN